MITIYKYHGAGNDFILIDNRNETFNVAKELKRLEKDYPIIETDYDSMRKMLYAQPEEMPNVIDADFEEVEGDPLATLDNIISGKKPKRGRRK